MCGLLSFLGGDGSPDGRAAAVTAALPATAHRGPDESTVHDGGVVVSGFQRLAVVDLDHSHQPMRWGPPGDPGRYTVVFNGEIYNHPELRAELVARHGAEFATRGDTEVLVAAHHYWGPEAVTRLRGMFAFLIWDAREQMLTGARDPFGIKPLYCATGPAGTAFASEKKCLLELGPVLGLDPVASGELDHDALRDYLVLQYVPEPASMHRAVRRIESGTAFTLRPGGRPRSRRYFLPVFHDGSGTGPRVHRRIAAALEESVAMHLRADVPVGAFLSGGIDSTAIAALARRHDPHLTTFTAGFDRPGFSEIDVAAESAAALGVRHVTRVVSAREMMESLPSIIWYLDDPVADPALVPLWFIAREAAREVTVVLSGEGADELFGGYRIYREPLSLAPFERVPGSLRRLLGRASSALPEGMRGKDLLRRGALPLEERYHGNARIFRPDQLTSVLRGHDPSRLREEASARHYRLSTGSDPVARMQHVDLFTWLRGDILVKADKMTMAHSLELRVPFLDPEVLAVAAGLPRSEKLAAGTTKYALRRALDGIVPPHVLHRPKLGFPVPIRHWLREEMQDWARLLLRESGAGELVDLAAVERMLDAHRSGPADHSRKLWAVLTLLIWHGIFVEDRITPRIPEPVSRIRSTPVIR
ncbi:asparagine synthase (glutamine-hydrolyzing) [Pseudonocardia petroleophila]|uniref:asparagine synthase (glutamine-hydrolyzing) n=1 Tax=Pseudonocardia petroleophila TaxID=37331 RepID=A0A7G7MGY8_9PSEU|nr:asparagine synthase (glutamine-hydrolyzing) [Pseudonocardia petroleophila]QNG52049.1 asparagine synthase (glutamine-hydrolyzing) [Pseudonocardia petroleophila]